MKKRTALAAATVILALLLTVWLSGNAIADLERQNMKQVSDRPAISGGHITGRVTDAHSDAGIVGVSVNIARQDAATAPVSITTDVNGYYTTAELATGVYQVSFNPPLPYFATVYKGFRPGNGFTPVTVTAPLTTTDINAVLQTGYVVSGTVTDSAGPLMGVEVYVYRGANDCYTSDVSADTGSDGTYRIGPLDPDVYHVYFESSDLHASEWYSDSPNYASATVINLTGDASNINAELAYGSRITGTVTNPNGLPLANVWIYIYPAGTSHPVSSGSTDASGQYTTTIGLAPSTYQLYFAAPTGYVSQWYQDKFMQTTATVISVTAGVTTTNINAQLAASTLGPTGAITGTVSAADTSQPLDAVVYAYDSAGAYANSVRTYTGTYVLSGLPPDSYKLYFAASSPYVPRYYHDRPGLVSADWVTVTASSTMTNINQALPRGGAITGTVTGPSGIPGVYVYAKLLPQGNFTRTIYTGVDGSYRLNGLDAGSYKVQFSPPTPFIGEWYSDMTNENTALTVSVALSATTPNVNAVLETGGVIIGIITAADTHASLPGAFANVYGATDGSYVGSAYADADGHYQTPNLPAGDYKISFSAGPWMAYLDEWYNHASSLDAALTVTVQASGVISNINAVLDRGGSISGWTFDALTGVLLNGVHVSVHHATTASVIREADSNNWGFYQVNGLASGQYKVQFSKDGYWTRWYSDTLDFAPALTVAVTAPNETPFTNVSLRWVLYTYLPLVTRGANMP
jgi:hypothetical protein